MRSNNFTAAGKGGIIQVFNWEGNLEWQSTVSDDQFGAHHDVEYLPSGNILLLRWERKTEKELIQAGKDTLFTPSEIWLPSIIEIEPQGTTEFDIVWEWHLFDHLVQDLDTTKDNFGIVAESPRKVNINYNNITERDWAHLNSIDFNVERNEILLSSRNFDEVWIIDHSTSSQEAASDFGGNSNLGGQLLYRFGNPSAYQDVNQSSILDGQHDAEFKSNPNSNIPCIQLYNNNNESARPSEIFEFSPKLNPDGGYSLENNRFDISGTTLIFSSNGDRNFDSDIMSNVQTLPNGNLLINAGRSSNFVEFDSLGNEVWRYKGPVSIFGPNPQGSNIIGSTFRIEKFSITNPMFDNLDTSIKAESIEINPNLSNCGLTSTTFIIPLEASVSPNPFMDQLTFNIPNFDEVDLEIYNAFGALVSKKTINSGQQFNSSDLQAGIYFLKLNKGNRESNFKMIKL